MTILSRCIQVNHKKKFTLHSCDVLQSFFTDKTSAWNGHILQSRHAGDIPTASILEMCFAVDISLFVHKSFAVMLSTSSNCTAESEETVIAQHANGNYADRAHKPMCHSSEARGEKGKSRKVRKGEQQAANRQSPRKREPTFEHTTSQSDVWGVFLCHQAQSQCLA